MLQYIINASVIWLVSLLCYELLFRRESFHQINRFYLLISLAGGLLLPLANLNKLLPAKNNVIAQPVSQVYQLKKNIGIADVQKVKTTNSLSHIQREENSIEILLWFIYAAGVFAGFFLIIREAVHLYQLYRSGNKSFEHGSIIVEAGKVQSPFSFFTIIFVNSKTAYSEMQWKLLITHEKEHGRQFHSLDNLLLLTLRILFWFHPLPHIYFRKLRMVHEFQADNAAATDIQQYGTFLLEQNLLQQTSLLTQSFNYSPIKTRIAMLTRTKSARAKLYKYVTVVPVVLLLVFFLHTGFRRKREEGKQSLF